MPSLIVLSLYSVCVKSGEVVKSRFELSAVERPFYSEEGWLTEIPEKDLAARTARLISYGKFLFAAAAIALLAVQFEDKEMHSMVPNVGLSVIQMGHLFSGGSHE
jgi:hypothetical protein